MDGSKESRWGIWRQWGCSIWCALVVFIGRRPLLLYYMVAVVVYTEVPPYQILLKAMVQLLSIFPGMLFDGIFVEWFYTSHLLIAVLSKPTGKVLSRSNNYMRHASMCPN